MELTFENLLAHINTVYILLTKSESASGTPSAVWTNHINNDDDNNSALQDPSLRLKVKSKYII